MRPRRDDLPGVAVLAALVVAWAYATWKLVARLSPEPEFDAREIYLPFARKLLDNATAFLGSEQSLWVAPFDYLFPALFGADAMRQKIGAIVLFLVLIALGYRIGELLFSRRAGVAVALLLAASPTLKIYIPTALTEPPFLFFTGVWLWALCEGHRAGRTGWWVIAGMALGLATLTRATYQLFIPIALLGGLVMWRTAPRSLAQHDVSAERDGRGIAIAHAIALAIVGLVILRNAVLFDFPSMSTGAGAGLFLGSNPMTDGYDAGYLGLLLDDGAVHGGKGHLAIESDRLMRAVAVAGLADQPFSVLARMYVQKLGAFLFVTQAETSGVPQVLRAWRIALLVLAAYGWWHVRVPAMKVLLGAALAYQVIVHLPVLYSFRYSVSAIDLPLSILAGVGIAAASSSLRRVAMLAVAVIVCAGGGYAVGHFSNPPSPHIDRVPHQDFWKQAFAPPLVATPAGPLDIEVKDAPGLHPWDNSILELTVSSEGHCNGVVVSYKREDKADFSTALHRRVSPGAEPAAVSIGSRLPPLELFKVGTLRIVAACDGDGSVRIHGARIASGRFATYYRARYLGLPDPLPNTLPAKP